MILVDADKPIIGFYVMVDNWYMAKILNYFV